MSNNQMINSAAELLHHIDTVYTPYSHRIDTLYTPLT